MFVVSVANRENAWESMALTNRSGTKPDLGKQKSRVQWGGVLNAVTKYDTTTANMKKAKQRRCIAGRAYHPVCRPQMCSRSSPSRPL